MEPAAGEKPAEVDPRTAAAGVPAADASEPLGVHATLEPEPVATAAPHALACAPLVVEKPACAGPATPERGPPARTDPAGLQAALEVLERAAKAAPQLLALAPLAGDRLKLLGPRTPERGPLAVTEPQLTAGTAVPVAIAAPHVEADRP